MWHNVWAVIRREYLQRVRSKWFIAATIGGPVIMAGLLVVPAGLAGQLVALALRFAGHLRPAAPWGEGGRMVADTVLTPKRV